VYIARYWLKYQGLLKGGGEKKKERKTVTEMALIYIKIETSNTVKGVKGAWPPLTVSLKLRACV